MMKPTTVAKLNELISKYRQTMEIMEHGAERAIREEGRAYGGFVRMAKGKIQEYMTEQIALIAWQNELSQDINRITINSDKIRIPIKHEYIDSLKDQEVKSYIVKNLPKYYYGLSVDKHIHIDRKFVIGIECKAYTENAMIKRILVDFQLLKTKFKNLSCYLFQLESQLGGDYGSATSRPLGSTQTHSIMSYFPHVDLKIVTLLEGDRKVDKPINKPEFFKDLKLQHLESAVQYLVDDFAAYKKK